MESRAWHPKFKKYAEFIVAHKNYHGLFYERGKDGQIKWVVTGKSKEGQKRKDWWDKKCMELGIKIQAGCYAKAARLIHPIKFHTCQICGKELSIEYVYPNKRLLLKFYKAFNKDVSPYILTIFEIIDKYIKNQSDIDKFGELLNIKDKKFKNVAELKSYIKNELVDKSNNGFLSPGVMSNPPDRFDGFHSDGACCRSESDKGRHESNLSRYNQDRRAYEYWSDGDWKKADRLMSQFSKHGVSADHIGPISLGFCHRAKFQPLTGGANSAKGNRMSLADVKSLLEDEKNGEQVVSWHSKYIWDLLKREVKSDRDALKLSKIMKTNLHWVLTLFAIIDTNGGREFLVPFLNPKYSYYDHRFVGFNPIDGTYEKIITVEKKGKNQENNVSRRFRIAFDALEQYKEKTNRWHKIWEDERVNQQVEILLSLVKERKSYEVAFKLLKIIFKRFATLLSGLW
jgi:Alw26I/Eco31I/Esp3I family type II restriction endonuclease